MAQFLIEAIMKGIKLHLTGSDTQVTLSEPVLRLQYLLDCFITWAELRRVFKNDCF